MKSKLIDRNLFLFILINSSISLFCQSTQWDSIYICDDNIGSSTPTRLTVADDFNLVVAINSDFGSIARRVITIDSSFSSKDTLPIPYSNVIQLNSFRDTSYGLANVSEFFRSADGYFLFNIDPHSTEISLTPINTTGLENTAIKEVVRLTNNDYLLTGEVRHPTTTELQGYFTRRHNKDSIVWTIDHEYDYVVEFDSHNDFFLVATESSRGILTIEKRLLLNGLIISSYEIDIRGHRFPPLVYFNPKLEITYIATFAYAYEISAYGEGGLIWSYQRAQTFDHTLVDKINDIIIDEHGSIYLLGLLNDETLGSGILLTKLDSDGNFIWESRYDNEESLGTWSSYFILEDGKIFISGQEDFEDQSWSNFILAYESQSGDLLFEKRILEVPNVKYSARHIIKKGDYLYTGGLVRSSEETKFSVRRFELPDLVTTTEERPIPRESSVQVYPNPTSNEITIKFDQPNGMTNVQVVGITGVKVNDIVTAGTTVKIPMGSLPTGIYFVVVIENGELIGREKLIIL